MKRMFLGVASLIVGVGCLTACSSSNETNSTDAGTDAGGTGSPDGASKKDSGKADSGSSSSEQCGANILAGTGGDGKTYSSDWSSGATMTPLDYYPLNGTTFVHFALGGVAWPNATWGVDQASWSITSGPDGCTLSGTGGDGDTYSASWSSVATLSPTAYYPLAAGTFVHFSLNGQAWPSSTWGVDRTSWSVRCLTTKSSCGSGGSDASDTKSSDAAPDGGPNGPCAVLAETLSPASPTGGEQTCPASAIVQCGSDVEVLEDGIPVPYCCENNLSGGTSAACATGYSEPTTGCGFCIPSTATYATQCGTNSGGYPQACPADTICVSSTPFAPNSDIAFACCPVGAQCAKLCQ